MPFQLFRLLNTSLSLAAGFLVGVPIALGDGVVLDSREYKVMLDPERFSARQTEATINQFWNEHLTQIIARSLDGRRDGSARHLGTFELGHQRQIVFRDTQRCHFSRHGFILRQRTNLRDNGSVTGNPELTVKFRSPDLFFANAVTWKAANDDARSKFEEDIAPVVEHTTLGAGNKLAVYANPPSAKSLFSRSLRQRVSSGTRLELLSDVFNLHRGLEAALDKAGGDASASQTQLFPGSVYRELVFSGARVDLGSVEAEFDLTLWYPWDRLTRPALAELSYKYDTSDGGVTAAVASRGLQLFRSLQESLAKGGLASPAHENKTAMGLPDGCPG